MLQPKNLILVIMFLLLLVFVYIGDAEKGPILPCIFNKITGLYCPGCGMTRALHSIMHFKLYQALRYNALIFIIPPLLLLQLLTWVKNYESKVIKAMIYIMLAIAILYGVARNIPGLNSLKPTTIVTNSFLNF